jgi:hypothetical protein
MANKKIPATHIIKVPGAKSALRGQVDLFEDNSGVALYPLSNNANDISGSYNGTWVGNENYANGIIGTGASFDGNSRIKLIDLTSLWNNGGFTLSLWFNSSDIVNFRNILSTDNGDGEGCIRVEQYNSKQMNIIGDTGSDLVSNKFYNLQENVWYHLVILADGVNYKLNSYLNAELGADPNQTLRSDLQVFSFTLGIGYDTGRYFKGIIDQVRVFNRLLTPTEIKTIYNYRY